MKVSSLHTSKYGAYGLSLASTSITSQTKKPLPSVAFIVRQTFCLSISSSVNLRLAASSALSRSSLLFTASSPIYHKEYNEFCDQTKTSMTKCEIRDVTSYISLLLLNLNSLNAYSISGRPYSPSPITTRRSVKGQS